MMILDSGLLFLGHLVCYWPPLLLATPTSPLPTPSSTAPTSKQRSTVQHPYTASKVLLLHCRLSASSNSVVFNRNFAKPKGSVRT